MSYVFRVISWGIYIRLESEGKSCGSGTLLPGVINMNRLMRYILVMIILMPMAHAGLCPKVNVSNCKDSLKDAVTEILECDADDPVIKECALVFVVTLSEADDQAPFYEYITEDQYRLGNVKAYANTLEMMKKKGSINSLQILYNLSKAIILANVDFANSTAMQKNQLGNLIDPIFKERAFGRSLANSEPRHRIAFIEYCKNRARSIKWPDMRTYKETKRIL